MTAAAARRGWRRARRGARRRVWSALALPVVFEVLSERGQAGEWLWCSWAAARLVGDVAGRRGGEQCVDFVCRGARTACRRLW